MTTNKLARYSTDLARICASIPSEEVRYDGDCGVIALAAMVTARASKGDRGDYAACAKYLIEKRVFVPGKGVTLRAYCETVRSLFGLSSRISYARRLHTVDEFLAAHKGWTGIICARLGDDRFHAMPVIDGIAYNTGWGEWLAGTMAASLRVA